MCRFGARGLVCAFPCAGCGIQISRYIRPAQKQQWCQRSWTEGGAAMEMLCFRRSRISKTPRISRHGSHTAETVRNIRGAFGFSFLWIFVCGSRKGSLAAQNRASFFSNRQIAHCLKSSEVLGAFKIYSRMNHPSAFIHKRFSAVRFFCSFHPLHNTLFKKSSRRAVFWGKISIRLQSKNRMHRN